MIDNHYASFVPISLSNTSSVHRVVCLLANNQLHSLPPGTHTSYMKAGTNNHSAKVLIKILALIEKLIK